MARRPPRTTTPGTASTSTWWSPSASRLRWFDLRGGRELEATADGILRLQTAPGLWVDSAALFANDHARAMATLERGLATPEHAAFVRRLSAR